MARLDESVAAANGGRDVPSVILRRSDPDDEDSKTNSLISTKQEELSRLLYESLHDLGERTEAAVRQDAMEREKSRVLHAQEREKTRVHERVENLRRGIDTLKAEKRCLVIEITANKNVGGA